MNQSDHIISLHSVEVTMGSCFSKKHDLSNEWKGKFIERRLQISIRRLYGRVNKPPYSYQQQDPCPCRPSQTKFDPYHRQFIKDPYSSLTGQ